MLAPRVSCVRRGWPAAAPRRGTDPRNRRLQSSQFESSLRSHLFTYRHSKAASRLTCRFSAGWTSRNRRNPKGQLTEKSGKNRMVFTRQVSRSQRVADVAMCASEQLRTIKASTAVLGSSERSRISAQSRVLLPATWPVFNEFVYLPGRPFWRRGLFCRTHRITEDCPKCYVPPLTLVTLDCDRSDGHELDIRKS